MTTKINLLPWREELRKEQDRQLFVLAAVAWLLMGVVVGYGHFHMTARIEAQNARNNYLKKEISKLDKQIKEIRDIKKKRAALVARMNVIYRLQADRTKLVYVMDGLVKTIPEGVYYTQLTKQGNTIRIDGTAQSNARVSALMRNFEVSPWFKNPDLAVINVKGSGGSRVSMFKMTVQQGSGTAKDVKKSTSRTVSDTNSKSAGTAGGKAGSGAAAKKAGTKS
ncbi:MAG: PilN domain-containing protein [Acidiferrobacterales bacterium]